MYVSKCCSHFARLFDFQFNRSTARVGPGINDDRSAHATIAVVNSGCAASNDTVLQSISGGLWQIRNGDSSVTSSKSRSAVEAGFTRCCTSTRIRA
eukprot:scaffold432303_cov15-Prasinocladus_malaysianus.AAC.1